MLLDASCGQDKADYYVLVIRCRGAAGKLSDYDALMSDPKANSCSKQACWGSSRTRNRSLLRDSGIDVEVDG